MVAGQTLLLDFHVRDRKAKRDWKVINSGSITIF
jgi:hypothetical protein